MDLKLAPVDFIGSSSLLFSFSFIVLHAHCLFVCIGDEVCDMCGVLSFFPSGGFTHWYSNLYKISALNYWNNPTSKNFCPLVTNFRRTMFNIKYVHYKKIPFCRIASRMSMASSFVYYSFNCEWAELKTHGMKHKNFRP